jgi:hypothetical protein
VGKPEAEGVMFAASRQHATLVVIEFGGKWPGWLPPAETGAVAVVAQHYEGEPISLVTQVATRLTRLEHSGWRFRSMLLVSNGKTDPASLAARAVLARGMLSRLQKSRGCRLVLCGDPRKGRRACYTLEHLAAALDETALGSGVSVSLRHGLEDPVYWPASPQAQLAHAC